MFTINSKLTSASTIRAKEKYMPFPLISRDTLLQTINGFGPDATSTIFVALGKANGENYFIFYTVQFGQK